MSLVKLIKRILPVSYKKLEAESEKNKSEILLEIAKLHKKVADQEQEISDLIKQNSSALQKADKAIRLSNEMIWGEVFNNTINGSEWFNGKEISPGRWALGYGAMYLLYRVLNDFHPHNILELGLGQSSVMTMQYAKSFPTIKHTIIESDKKWIDFFKRSHVINDNSNILQCDIEYVNYKSFEVRAFKNFLQKLQMGGVTDKLDLILIDAPVGGDLKGYSRIDILPLIPEYLKDSFVIILDDMNRTQEKMTFNDINNRFIESNLIVRHSIYSGEKDTCIWVSDDLNFLLSM